MKEYLSLDMYCTYMHFDITKGYFVRHLNCLLTRFKCILHLFYFGFSIDVKYGFIQNNHSLLWLIANFSPINVVTNCTVKFTLGQNKK